MHSWLMLLMKIKGVSIKLLLGKPYLVAHALTRRNAAVFRSVQKNPHSAGFFLSLPSHFSLQKPCSLHPPLRRV